MRLALVLAMLVAGSAAHAQGVAPSKPAYVGAAQRVVVAPGRSMNLVCAGSGPTAVLFDAGGSDWSAIWSTVQPAVAAKARACSYDRAGLGYSDPAPGARSPFAVVEDLHALIEAAGLRGPIVLVGHSLGGFNVKLFAALYPREVAGLVLIDPSEERSWDRTRAAVARRYGALAARSELLDMSFIDRLVGRYKECTGAARAKPLAVGSPEYRRCTDPPRPKLDKAVAAERDRIMGSATYQEAQASEVANSVYGTTAANPAYAQLFRRGMFGRLPMIVLTHVEPPSTDPLDRLGTEQGIALARETAKLSRTGQHRLVSGSGHYIQFDRPDALIGAIEDVLAVVNGKARMSAQSKGGRRVDRVGG